MQIHAFLKNPTLNQILRHLKRTPGKGILMKNNNSNNTCGYFDAYWIGSFDRKLTTGFCIVVGENLVTWKNKKQNVVARLSTEAEYHVMASTTILM